jgi:hypothetical protein
VLLVRQPLTMAKPINQSFWAKPYPLFVTTIYFMRYEIVSISSFGARSNSWIKT